MTHMLCTDSAVSGAGGCAVEDRSATELPGRNSGKYCADDRTEYDDALVSIVVEQSWPAGRCVARLRGPITRRGLVLPNVVRGP